MRGERTWGKWVWVKVKPPQNRRFWSMCPLTGVPFGEPIFDPLPNRVSQFGIARRPDMLFAILLTN